MATKTLRLDALIRQSRASEAGRSPEQQREVIDRWAATDGATIVAEHVGLGRSGKTMDRVDVNAVLERIRAGETDGVVVAWLDRFSRAPTDQALAVCRSIEQAGGKFFPIDLPGVDTNTPIGEFTFTMMLATGRLQWAQTAARYELNRKQAIAEGKHIGRPPFGYRFTDPTPKKGSHGVIDSHLVIEPAEADVVRELFERKAGGATWLELARYLDEAAPKPHGKLWSRQSVAGMIANRTYLGEVRSGPHVNAKAHKAIVTPAMWRRAQNGTGRRTPRGTYLLSGLARCESCSHTLHGSTLGRGSGARVYKCANRGCTARSSIMVHNLDAEVTEQFLNHYGEIRMQAVDDEEIVAARAAVADRTREVEAVAAVVPSHPTAVAAHQETLEAAEAGLAEAEDHLHDLEAAVDAVGPDARELRADWPKMSLADRRDHIRDAVEAVYVSRAPSPTAKVPAAERIRVAYRR